MTWRTRILLLSTLTASAAPACNDVSDSLRNERAGSGDEDPALAQLRQAVTAGPAMTRNLSNREYLNVVSDLIGERLPLDLQRTWTATTQFSGFDAVPWTNLDTKAVRDLSETLEAILDRAVVAPKVMTCSVTEVGRLPYDVCAKSIVEPFALRAYGRPLAPAETEALAKRYAAGVALAEGELTDPHAVFLDGVRAALGAVLLAPQLVTRIEAPPAPDFTGERELDAYELASRLAFMFTASIPDDELWQKAVDGTLASKPEVLAAEVERLVDARTDVFVQSFMGQWFDFRAYDSTAPGTLEHAMWNESRRDMADVLKDDLTVTAIVQPGFTYLNQELATHYNVIGQFSSELTRVAIDERSGVHSKAAGCRSARRRSRRADPPRPPRAGPPAKVVHRQTRRCSRDQKVSDAIPARVGQAPRVHRNAGPACAGCHEYMDPIGLGLEGFDMRGRLRNAYADTGRPVESESTLLGRPFSRFGELNTMIAELPDYHRCAAEKLTVYATRRVVHAGSKADADLLAYLTYSADGRPPSLRAMISRLVRSKAFSSVDHGGAR